jgi:hypothetical protein
LRKKDEERYTEECKVGENPGSREEQAWARNLPSGDSKKLKTSHAEGSDSTIIKKRS